MLLLGIAFTAGLVAILWKLSDREFPAPAPEPHDYIVETVDSTYGDTFTGEPGIVITYPRTIDPPSDITRPWHNYAGKHVSH